MAEEDTALVPSLGGKPRRKGPMGGGPRGPDGKFLKRKEGPVRPWVRAAKKEKKPVVYDPSYEFPLIQVVDELAEKYRLSKRQCMFFVVRPNFSNDADAARSLGLSPSTANKWRFAHYQRKSGPPTDFHGAENELYDRIKEAAQKKFNSMAFKVATRTDELLDAKKTVVTKVKTEDGMAEVVSYEPDHDARFKGIQAASRWLGEWGTESKVVQNTQYVTVMDQFGKLMGRIVEEKVIEGQFKEREEDDG